MGWWITSPSSIILLLGATTACLTGVIYALCSQQRQSRCSRISCLWGCVDCQRDVMSDDLAKAEMEADEHNQTANPSHPPPSSSKYEDV